MAVEGALLSVDHHHQTPFQDPPFSVLATPLHSELLLQQVPQLHLDWHYHSCRWTKSIDLIPLHLFDLEHLHIGEFGFYVSVDDCY